MRLAQPISLSIHLAVAGDFFRLKDKDLGRLNFTSLGCGLESFFGSCE